MVAADLTGPKEGEGKREYGEEEWREMRESVLECGGMDVDRHQAKNTDIAGIEECEISSCVRSAPIHPPVDV